MSRVLSRTYLTCTLWWAECVNGRGVVFLGCGPAVIFGEGGSICALYLLLFTYQMTEECSIFYQHLLCGWYYVSSRWIRIFPGNVGSLSFRCLFVQGSVCLHTPNWQTHKHISSTQKDLHYLLCFMLPYSGLPRSFVA